ncbi:MAG: dephospho-CoA kinase [Planctomycetaceae bacterium]|nr:dephospho-CoA kinase [Planctomycetaceae bacterium]
MSSLSPAPIPPTLKSRKVVIGLIGGIGCGKSTLARAAVARRPLILIDADWLGHQALDDHDVQLAIRSRFGSNVFGPEGRVDRRSLGKLVFGPEPHSAAARSDLEAIVHPWIERAARREIDAANRAPEIEGIVLDAALLLEAGWRNWCDLVVFIEVSDQDRWERIGNRGWTREDWQRREATQLPLAEKRRQADVVLPNPPGEEEAAVEALVRLIDHYCRRSGNGGGQEVATISRN